MLANELEAALRDLVLEIPLDAPLRERRPGRPPVLTAMRLWLGFLLCVLRGFSSQRAVWRLVSLRGFWGHPPVAVCEEAVYLRLAQAKPTVFHTLFTRVTTLLLARFSDLSDTGIAAFATDILALDHCTLDPVLRKLKLLRGVPPGAAALIPGRLATLFDLRRQLFRRVDFEADASRNEKFRVERLLNGLKPGTLLLSDLGYFAFTWFDLLQERGFHYVSRLRAKTTLIEKALLYEGRSARVRLRESWVYLGKYHRDRAATPARLVEVVFPHVTYRYITNVLDPQLLPAADLVRLYARRWDIEQAFNLLKTHLKLYLLWSGGSSVVQLQVFATLIVAQIVLAFRNDLARRARADLREVSLPLMIECLRGLADDGKDPLHELALHGRRMGIIRPFRGCQYVVPQPKPEEYTYPQRPPPPRKPRHDGKDSGPGRPARPKTDRTPRTQSARCGKRTTRAAR